MNREIKFRAWDKNTNLEHIVCTQDKPIDNRGAHNFRGYEISGGYVLRKVNNHPYANSRGYYPEHRLVMEEYLGRFLQNDEVVHHKDGDRRNNQLENLEVIVSQSKHASIEDRGKRNPNGTIIASEPIFEEIKYRLLDKDRGITKIYTLSKLINTTFRKGCFQFRGRFTGLKDRNGKEIYEGDILQDSAHYPIGYQHRLINQSGVAYYDVELGGWYITNELKDGQHELPNTETLQEATAKKYGVIGNIYENLEPTSLNGKEKE